MATTKYVICSGPTSTSLIEKTGLVEHGHDGVAIASRWPLRDVRELDLHVTPRTGDFPCTTLIAEIAVPDPVGPLFFVNHFPNWRPAYEHERELQTVIAGRAIEELVNQRGGHVVLAGDLDADPAATSIRFWTGRHARFSGRRGR